MDRFKYLNFATIYSSEGDVEVDLGTHACFSDVFHDEGRTLSNEYHIHAYKEFHLINESKSNGCFLDLEHVNKHLEYLSRIFPITYDVTEEIDRSMRPYYDIYVELTGHNLVHRFALTWIRALYEFPYCIYVMDIYKCKKFKAFENINVFNILNIIAATHEIGDDIHMFTIPGCVPKLLKFNEIKEQIDQVEVDRHHELSELFSTDQENPNSISPNNFFSDEDFKIRKQLYIDLYNNIKDGKEL